MGGNGGQANPANQPISGKIANMALFNPCMEFKNFLGQMTSFEVLRKCHFVILSKICLRLRPCAYLVVTVTSSGILKAKQKLGRTFNSDKLGGIDFTKISKLTMCSA